MSTHKQTHKQAEEDLDRFFTLSLDLLCIAGFDGHFKRLNPAFERTLGFTLEELLAKPFLAFVHPGDHEATAAVIQQLSSGAETMSFESRFMCKDGSYKWLSWTAIPSPDSQLIYATARDVTGRKEAEAGLLAQKNLSESLVAVARATAERLALEDTLKNALSVATRLTGAVQGSLFLVGETDTPDGPQIVTYSVISPDLQSEIPGQRSAVISQVMDKGLVGWVARHRQAALITDAVHDERWLTLPDQPYVVRSALAVPILSGSALAGVLTLLHPQPGQFDTDHLYLMQAAADQMALAVHNAQIFEAQRRMTERQATLYEILRAMSQQLDPGVVTQVAVDAIVEFAGWPHVAIALPTEDRRHWVARAASGALAAAVGLESPIEEGVIGRTLRTRRTQYVPGVSLDPDYKPRHSSIRSELAVPVRRGDRVLGVLNLESEQVGGFDAEDVLLAESLAEAIGLAMDNAWLYAETRKYATDLSALYAVARATSRSLALEEVFSQALSSALTLLNFEAGLIGLADPGDRNSEEAKQDQSPPLHLVAQHQLLPAQLERIQRSGLKDTLCAYVHERGESLMVGNFDQEVSPDIKEMVAEMAAFGWRACAGIPLLHQERSLGVMCLFAHRPHTSSDYDLALLTTVGHQVATAVANARLYQITLGERSRLQALIKSSRDGVILVGLDGRILVVNTPVLQLLGMPGRLEDWLDRSLGDAIDVLRHRAPAVVKAALAEIRRIQKGDEPPSDGECEAPPHTIRWFNLPVRAGSRPLGRLVILRDVTEERALERLREDMTHTMVHDLRSPLTSIYGAAELLHMDAVGILPPDLREVLEIVRKNTRNMLELVNSILDVSRLESGRMPVECEAFTLAGFVGEILRAQGPLANRMNIRLESDVPPGLPPAWADVELIRRVLQNLVGNAIKFTPPGGVVRVTGKVEEREKQPVLLVSVSDTGSGIPPEIQSRLFQKFVTGQQLGRGSGLGLAFCKLALEAHGERIWVESTPGQGATFTFSLAMAQDANAKQG